MKRIEIRFDLVPKPKGRPRIRCKPHPSAYTPPATVKYENAIKAIATKAVLDRGNTIPFFNGDRAIQLKVFFGIPVPYTLNGVKLKTQDRQALVGMVARGKTDVDNLVKSLMDGLEGPLYENDGIVGSVHAEKWFSNEPTIKIYAEEMLGWRNPDCQLPRSGT